MTMLAASKVGRDGTGVRKDLLLEELDGGVVEIAFGRREGFMGEMCSAVVGRFAGGAGGF